MITRPQSNIVTNFDTVLNILIFQNKTVVSKYHFFGSKFEFFDIKLTSLYPFFLLLNIFVLLTDSSFGKIEQHGKNIHLLVNYFLCLQRE